MPGSAARYPKLPVTLIALAVAGTTACMNSFSLDFDNLCADGPSAVSRIEFLPSAELRVPVGDEVNIQARVLDPKGNLDFVCAPTAFVSSADTTTASVSGGGSSVLHLTVRGIKVGATSIRVRAGQRSDSLSVVVTRGA